MALSFVDDFEQIGSALAKLEAEKRWEITPVAELAHVWGWTGNICQCCGVTRNEIDDNLAPKICSGVSYDRATEIYESSLGFVADDFDPA